VLCSGESATERPAARAGMFPQQPFNPLVMGSAPRVCGDGPTHVTTGTSVGLSSSRVRGWSLRRARVHDDLALLTAPAWMVPCRSRRRRRLWPAPRTCGDGPGPSAWKAVAVPCPALAGMVPGPAIERPGPAPAPRASGDGPDLFSTPTRPSTCFPCVRGWSLGQDVLQVRSDCFPHPRGWSRHVLGDVARRGAAPRVSGDVPQGTIRHLEQVPCFPRVRGWSPALYPDRGIVALLPARAGMVPTHGRKSLRTGPAAPACAGMVPEADAGSMGIFLLSACAGMCRLSQGLRGRGWPASRASGDSPYDHRREGWRWGSVPHMGGDGPAPESAMVPVDGCFPRERGWSYRRPRPIPHPVLLLARVGMVPAPA
jgi:hypothetical protein